ncbi:MAG: dihydropteroate synthase [Candidatus Omnitrophota bacterium]|nr:dihydropteroate synthase [Candidatus Omnitrophota bacterium]
MSKKRKLNLNGRTYIMGVLNITPDSFSDGGKYYSKRKALSRALQMAAEGADIIDVGGESTRPGARDIGIDEECSRVIPVIEAIVRRIDLPISIDTRKAAVARSAILAGAAIINDVSGLKYDPMMAKVAARASSAVVVMHMKGAPRDMQRSPRYRNLIEEVKAGLKESIGIALAAGVDRREVIIDPGIGFGKTIGHNLEILNRLDEFSELGSPVCVGVSRKSFIGRILGIPKASDRLSGTIAACVVAVMKGAAILRVHDIREAVDAAVITDNILKAGVK